MAKQTYTEALQEILDRLEAGGTSAVVAARLDEIARRQDETIVLLRKLNGSVREHGQALAQHSQWIADHQQAHTVLDKRVDYLGTKLNFASAINLALSFIAGALGLTPR